MFNLDNPLEMLIPSKLPVWVTVIKIFLIILSLFLFAGIVYFAIFTDYLYYRFFESMEDWYNFKAKKKTKKEVVKGKRPKILKKLKQPILEVKKPTVSPELTRESPWERIFSKLKEKREMGWQIALIDADKLVNQKLDELKIEGRNLTEKIEKLPEDFLPNLEKLKQARKLVEQVLRGERKLSKEEVERVVKIYKEVYEHLSNKA
ncbi:hypothetical protein J7J24_00115 [bacterium]|nr:hypothetical protein [bacterium]